MRVSTVALGVLVVCVSGLAAEPVLAAVQPNGRPLDLETPQGNYRVKRNLLFGAAGVAANVASGGLVGSGPAGNGLSGAEAGAIAGAAVDQAFNQQRYNNGNNGLGGLGGLGR